MAIFDLDASHLFFGRSVLRRILVLAFVSSLLFLQQASAQTVCTSCSALTVTLNSLSLLNSGSPHQVQANITLSGRLNSGCNSTTVNLIVFSAGTTLVPTPASLTVSSLPLTTNIQFMTGKNGAVRVQLLNSATGAICSTSNTLTLNASAPTPTVSNTPTSSLTNTLTATPSKTSTTTTTATPASTSTVTDTATATVTATPAATTGPCNTSWFVNGSAGVGSSAVTLTPNMASQAGSAWNTVLLNLNSNFDMTFMVFAGSDSNGSDGMGFVLQALGTTALGGDGGGLGFGNVNGTGISPSLDVEIDTHDNTELGDTPQDHLGIDKNGVLQNAYLAGPIAALPSGATLKDGVEHNFEVTWNASTHTINVFFDGNLRLTLTQDIVSTIFGGNPNVYWGFTGATGGNFNLQYFKPTSCLPTSTPTNSATSTATLTVTNTPTATTTATPSFTATDTTTLTSTATATDSATVTPSDSPTSTPTTIFMVTNTATDTATLTPTPTVTNSATVTSSDTPTFTVTDTASNTPTDTPNCCQTATPWNPPVLAVAGGLAVDRDPSLKRVYVTDSGTNGGMVEALKYDGTVDTTFNAGGTVPGQVSAANDSIPSLANVFAVAAGSCAYDGVYVVQRGGTGAITKLDTNGHLVWVSQQLGGGSMRYVYVDGAGSVYATDDGGDIFILDKNGVLQTTLSGMGLVAPTGMVKGAGATLYVADSGNNRIVGLPQTGTFAFGTPVPVAAMPPAAQGEPNGLANDLAGNFYVAAQGYIRFDSNWANPVLCSFPTMNGAYGIGVDETGAVYTADFTGANTVTKMQPCIAQPAFPTCTPTPLGGVAKPLANTIEGKGGTPTSTPTVTPSSTPTPSPTPSFFTAAAPNISRSGQPIQFLVNLEKPAKVDLKLFSLFGEEVFEETLQGNSGMNSLSWNLQNQLGRQVASGLYVYVLTVNDGTLARTQRGKVVVIH